MIAIVAWHIYLHYQAQRCLCAVKLFVLHFSLLTQKKNRNER